MIIGLIFIFLLISSAFAYDTTFGMISISLIVGAFIYVGIEYEKDKTR